MASSSSSNLTFINRLRRECLDLQQNPVPFTCAGPTTDSLKQWLVVFEGEPDSLYEGGTFFALLTFDDDYPFTPPTLEFKTRIYHCNIYQTTGLVKHDLFDKNWSPTVTIRQIIQKVANLLVNCEPDHCAMKELGLQFKHERSDYDRMARLWTKNFMTVSIYDSEQYLFELAQSFIRSRAVFTSLELGVFDLLLSCNDGLPHTRIAEQLNLHYIDNESRCLQDVLDCLKSMKFLEYARDTSSYSLTKFARNLLLPNRELLTQIDGQFYEKMPRLDESVSNDSLKDSIHLIMLLRIKQLVNLTSYSNVSIDSSNENADVLIIWRQDGLLKQKVKQAFETLPAHRESLLILVVPNDADEVTLTLNIFSNMTTTESEEENPKEFYSEKFLRQVGFRSIERVQSVDGLQLVLAHK